MRAAMVYKKISCSPFVKATLFRTFCSNMYCGHLWHDFRKSALKKLIVGYNHSFRFLMKFHRNCSATGMFVFNCVPSFMEMWRIYIYDFTQRLTNSDNAIVAATVSSCRISSFFLETMGLYIIHGTRRLNLSSNLHTVFVGLIPFCLCDNCCIAYLYMGLQHCCLA